MTNFKHEKYVLTRSTDSVYVKNISVRSTCVKFVSESAAQTSDVEKLGKTNFSFFFYITQRNLLLAGLATFFQL